MKKLLTVAATGVLGVTVGLAGAAAGVWGEELPASLVNVMERDSPSDSEVDVAASRTSNPAPNPDPITTAEAPTSSAPVTTAPPTAPPLLDSPGMAQTPGTAQSRGMAELSGTAQSRGMAELPDMAQTPGTAEPTPLWSRPASLVGTISSAGFEEVMRVLSGRTEPGTTPGLVVPTSTLPAQPRLSAELVAFLADLERARIRRELNDLALIFGQPQHQPGTLASGTLASGTLAAGTLPPGTLLPGPLASETLASETSRPGTPLPSSGVQLQDPVPTVPAAAALPTTPATQAPSATSPRPTAPRPTAPVTAPATQPPVPPPTAAERVVTNGLGVFARTGSLELELPSRRVELVGFHEASRANAIDLSEVGGAPEVRVGLLPSRFRGTGARSAADIVSEPGAEILSPVSGTVVRAGSYELYCRHTDQFLVIEPDGHPGIEVTLLHIEGLEATVGSHLQAGQRVAASARKFGFASQIDRYTQAPSWPHVHVQVVDTRVEVPPSTGGGC